MKIKPLAFLSCKIMAIVVLLQALRFVSYPLLTFIHAFRQQGASSEFVTGLFVTVLQLVLLLAGAVILWTRADRIASLVIRGLDEEETGVHIEYKALQTAGFSILGLYILVSVLSGIFEGLPRILLEITSQRQYSHIDQGLRVQHTFWVIDKVIRASLGVVLLFGSRAVVHFVGRIRTAGLPPIED